MCNNNIIDLTDETNIKFGNFQGDSVYINPDTKESNILINIKQLEGMILNKFTINNLTS